MAGKCGIGELELDCPTPFVKSRVAGQGISLSPQSLNHILVPLKLDSADEGDVGFSLASYFAQQPLHELPSPSPLKLPMFAQFAIAAALNALDVPVTFSLVLRRGLSHDCRMQG